MIEHHTAHAIMNTRTQPIALRSVIALALLVLGTGLHAQVLIGTDGGTTVLPSNTISWSVGEPIIGTGATTNGAMTQGYQQPTGKLIYYSRATGNVSDPTARESISKDDTRFLAKPFSRAMLLDAVEKLTKQ